MDKLKKNQIVPQTLLMTNLFKRHAYSKQQTEVDMLYWGSKYEYVSFLDKLFAACAHNKQLKDDW